MSATGSTVFTTSAPADSPRWRCVTRSQETGANGAASQPAPQAEARPRPYPILGAKWERRDAVRCCQKRSRCPARPLNCRYVLQRLCRVVRSVRIEGSDSTPPSSIRRRQVSAHISVIGQRFLPCDVRMGAIWEPVVSPSESDLLAVMRTARQLSRSVIKKYRLRAAMSRRDVHTLPADSERLMTMFTARVARGPDRRFRRR
jgi:hypothetical protein